VERVGAAEWEGEATWSEERVVDVMWE